RLLRSHHVLGVPAIVGNTGGLSVLAVEKIPTAAGRTNKVVSSMPADAHPLSGAPGAHAFADRVNHPDHFMTGNTRIGDGVRPAFLHDTITVADTAGFHFDAHLALLRLRKRSLDQF